MLALDDENLEPYAVFRRVDSAGSHSETRMLPFSTFVRRYTKLSE